jgi:hypothetical protein
MATIVSRRRRMRMTTTRMPQPPTPRSDVRIDVVTIFPAFFDVLEVSLLGAPAMRASSTCVSTTCATSRMTAIARSTTRRTAGARAW